MDWHRVAKISERVYWVGARDWSRRIFDSLIPLPKGTSYNSYLVLGGQKKALVDTVNPGFEQELEAKVRGLMEPSELDYLIMNHAEPDHAGGIPHMLALCPNAVLVTTKQGAKMAQTFFNVPDERIKQVADGETLDLGGGTLRFIEAPMLHWPETMFTYLEEDKVLFPCDFLGSHLANPLYDDEVEDLLVHAKRYFGEIMMPFRAMAEKGIEKIRNLEIELIAPSHGPIHRNPDRILGAYRSWARGETGRKVTVVYVTMWGSTERMIRPVVETLSSEGIEVALYNLVTADIGDLAMDLVDSRGIVLGAPTVLGGAHPLAQYAALLVKALKPPVRYGAVLSSFGWGGGAVKNIGDILGSLKLDIVGVLDINGPPTEADIEKAIEIGRTMASRVKEESAEKSP